jgi:hypothetical protein
MTTSTRTNTLSALGMPTPWPQNLYRHNIVTLDDLARKSIFDLSQLEHLLTNHGMDFSILLDWVAQQQASLRKEAFVLHQSISDIGLQPRVVRALFDARLPTVLHVYEAGTFKVQRLTNLGVRSMMRISTAMSELHHPLTDDGVAVNRPAPWHVRHSEARLFTDPYSQLDNIRRWNERRGWGFSEADLAAAATFSEPWPMAPGHAWVLTPFLETFEDTYHELWNVIDDEGRAEMRQDPGTFEGALKLIEGAVHTPGLYWILVDLLAAQPVQSEWSGKLPPPLISQSNHCHAEVLAAAAHFPSWLLNAKPRSGSWALAAGYRIGGHSGDDDWIPCIAGGMYRDDGRVSLDMSYAQQAGTVTEQFSMITPIRLDSIACVRSVA